MGGARHVPGAAPHSAPVKPAAGQVCNGEVRLGTVRIRFYAELGDSLPAERRGREFDQPSAPGRTVKDLIESLGVPHTEVDLILVNGISVDFAHHVADGDRVSVYPVFEALDISPLNHLRPQPLRVVRFALDVHLGRLAAYLRLAGFDSAYRNDWSDSQLVETALAEHRIILTRDRRLLMRSVVTHGHLIRHTDPWAQLTEVLKRFDLWASLQPFARCMVCNGLIEPADKTAVLDLLPPRTATYYAQFWRCTGCGRVYWEGSHFRALKHRLEQATHAVKRDDSLADTS